MRTADGQLGASSDELEEGATGGAVIPRKNFYQVTDRFAFDIETMISLDSFTEC